MLKFSLSFAERQFGNRIVDKSDCRDADWKMQIVHQINVCFALGNEYQLLTNNMVRSYAYQDTFREAIHYFEKSLFILESWRIYFDSKDGARARDTVDKKMKISTIYYNLSSTETLLCSCYMRMNNYDKAEDYSNRAIFHAKLVVIVDV